jgi:chromosome segregation ATPase
VIDKGEEMKSTKGILVVSVFFACYTCKAGEMSTQLQSLHRNIGKELVEMRRTNPQLQQSIYSLLDEVGSIYRLSNKALANKKKFKLALREEQDMRISFQKDNESLKVKTSGFQKTLDQENSRVSYYQQQIDDLTKERDNLSHKKFELETKEREYVMRIKTLEDAHAKAALPKENVSITLVENKDKTQEPKAENVSKQNNITT